MTISHLTNVCLYTLNHKTTLRRWLIILYTLRRSLLMVFQIEIILLRWKRLAAEGINKFMQVAQKECMSVFFSYLTGH